MAHRYLSSRPRRKTLPVILGITAAAAVCIGGFFLGRALLDPYDCRILDNVSVGGLDIGGMKQEEARKALETAASETLLQLSLEVSLPEQTILLTPSDTGIQLDIRSAVKEAYQYGRTGTKEDRQAVSLESANTKHDIGLLPYLTYDEQYIQNLLRAYAAQFDTDLTEPSHQLEGDMPGLSTAEYDEGVPCQTLVLTMGVPKTRLDADAVYAQITALLDQAFAAAAGEAYYVNADVPPEIEPEEPDLDAIFAEYDTAPVSDSLDMNTYKMVSGSYGYTFNLEQAKELVKEAQYGEVISIPMEYVRPEILGDEVYFRDVLGSCETKHSSNENRTDNLRLICKELDGLILQPGEAFSYNGVIGERTEEKGYKAAPAYSGSHLTNAIGGGVCQGSTTLYNCVLLADLEVITRLCHGATVTYVPLGLDAAVNWGTTDFEFRNSANFPIKITAEVSDGYMKMKILGTDEKDYYIKMTSGYDDSNPALIYAVSYKNKYDKQTDELISKEREAFSTYYRNIG